MFRRVQRYLIMLAGPGLVAALLFLPYQAIRATGSYVLTGKFYNDGSTTQLVTLDNAKATAFVPGTQTVVAGPAVVNVDGSYYLPVPAGTYDIKFEPNGPGWSQGFAPELVQNYTVSGNQTLDAHMNTRSDTTPTVYGDAYCGSFEATEHDDLFTLIIYGGYGFAPNTPIWWTVQPENQQFIGNTSTLQGLVAGGSTEDYIGAPTPGNPFTLPAGPHQLVADTGVAATSAQTAFSLPVHCPGFGIEVMPGSSQKNIQPGQEFPVALLSRADFNAPAQVDQSSLAIGLQNTLPNPLSNARHCDVPADVNGDGLADLTCYFAVANLPTGSYDIQLRGRTTNEGSDPAGFKFMKNGRVNYGPIIDGTPNPTNTHPHFTWLSLTGVDHYDVYRDGQIIGAASTTEFTDYSILSDGTYSYSVTPVYINGETGWSSDSADITLDTVAPTITARYRPAPSASGWYRNPTVSFLCRDNGITLPSSACSPLYKPIAGEGPAVSVTKTATDAAGNIATYASDIAIDNTPPVLAEATLTSQPGLGGTVLSVSATDPLSGVATGRYAIGDSSDPTNWADLTYNDGQLAATIPSGLATGTYTVAVEATDTAGNTSPVSQYQLAYTDPATSGQHLTGIVTDETGFGVANVEISATEAGNPGIIAATTQSGTDGSYTLNLQPGVAYDVHFVGAANLYYPATVSNLTLFTDQVLNQQLSPVMRTFSGTVRDGNGLPIEGVSVRLVAPTVTDPFPPVQYPPTDANGYFSFQVPARLYELFDVAFANSNGVYRPGLPNNFYISNSLNNVPPAGQQATFDLRNGDLVQDIQLSVVKVTATVLNVDDSPMPYVSVDMQEHDAPVAITPTDPAGAIYDGTSNSSDATNGQGVATAYVFKSNSGTVDACAVITNIRTCSGPQATAGDIAVTLHPPVEVPAAPIVWTVDTVTRTSPVIYWNNVPGATSYQVYRADETLLATVTANSYVDTAASQSGYYSYLVKAVNILGQTSGYSSSYVQILYDGQAPQVFNGGITPDANFPAGSSETVRVQATDDYSGVAQVEYFEGTDPGQGNATQLTYANGLATGALTAGSTPGLHTIFIRARDANGNWSTILPVTYGIQLPAPTGLQGPTPTQVLSLSWNPVPGADHYLVYGLAGQPIVTTATNFTTPNASEGSIKYSVVAVTADGVAGLTAPIVRIVVDRTAPVITNLALTPDTITSGATTTLTANVADTYTGVSRFEYYVDTDPGLGLGTGVTPVSGSISAVLGDTLAGGTHQVYVRAKDGVGNWSASQSVTLTVSAPAPDQTLGYDQRGTTLDTNNHDVMNGTKFTVGGVGGTAKTISAYVGAVQAAPYNKFQLAIYTVNSDGTPGALVANTAEGTLTANSWNSLPIAASLAANTQYWFVYNTNATQSSRNNLYFTADEPGIGVWANQTYGMWPSSYPVAAATSTNQRFSLTVTFAPNGPVPPAPTPLVGDTVIESGIDSSLAGTAEAFPYAATTTGSLTHLSIYLNSSNQSTEVVVGLYANLSNRPGALLGQAVITTPLNGTWNSVALPSAVNVTAGVKYWIAVLSPVGKGAVGFRDKTTGTGPGSVSSTSTNLTVLPFTWTTDQLYSTRSMSAYGY